MKASQLINNLGLKIVSLILAVIVWFYAAGEGQDQITVRVPLEVESVAPAMTVVHGARQTLRVVLQAPRNLIHILSSFDVTAHHKIAPSVKAGEYSFKIGEDDFHLPPGDIRIVEIYPPIVHVRLDEVTQKKLKVNPMIQGEPAVGFSINQADVLVDPNAVVVEMPRVQSEKFETIDTEPIDVVGRLRSFRRKVKLEFGPDIKPVNTDSVDVYVPLIEQFSSKTFENIPVKVIGIPDKTFSIFLNPAKVSLQLKGPLRLLETMKPEEILAYVEVTGLKNGRYDLPLTVNAPSNISLKGDSPTVHVIIEEIKR
ncbi:MAG: hypothetical protein HY586_02000 [Candidatus Omnitrophica bacterium]|nr:hypothetical protein [Candidatus Omnitrophota bacterium]